MSEHHPPSHAPEQQDVPVRDDLDSADSQPNTENVELSEDMPGYDVWRHLWFIKLSDERGAKMPADEWGGYDQDFEVADTVYSVEEVAASDHDRWGVVGINAQPEWPTTPNLIVFDLDIHEDDAPDLSDIGISHAVRMMDIDPVIVESQSGGVHLYALVDEPTVKESEFDFPEWVDIRGEAVKHHVVAPDCVPGADTEYELRAEATIPEFESYADVCKMVSVRNEQVIDYDGSLSGPATGPTSYDAENPPADMPTCYERALSARADASFREQHGNPWKVDTLCGQLGIALGYDVETVADHFEQYPKGGDSSEFDRNLTVSHLDRLAGKMRGDSAEDLRAPSALTLRGHGILETGEACSCDLHRHHDPDASGCSPFYAYLRESYGRDEDLLRACLEARDEHEELEGVKPPYAALREIARQAGLPMEDDGTLGETTWSVARSAFEEMDASEV